MWDSSWARNVQTNIGREFDFHVTLGIFYMPQICDMGQEELMSNNALRCSSRWVADCELPVV